MSNVTWIRSPIFDSCWILAPSFVISLVVLVLPGVFQQGADVPLWGWVVFVLLIDVAHVYGTLFRTYFDSTARGERSALLIAVPLLCWLIGVALYSWGAQNFWRVLAYIAVFHFLRQQYGFMRLYSRGETSTRFDRALQAAAVYAATIYPMIYWHTHLPRNFSWFTNDDFVSLPGTLDSIGFVLYILILAVYIAREIWNWRSFNFPRNAIVVGTALSWFLGIVVFNSDFSFTATNVVAHGLPYFALSWVAWEKSSAVTRTRRWGWAAVFLLTLFGLAYFEEWLWDGLVWSERSPVFGNWLPMIEDAGTLAWLVPLLTLPQSTHYILDGFVWRRGWRTSESEAESFHAVAATP